MEGGTGTARMCCAMISLTVSPLNTRRPVRSQYPRQPTPYRSARPSTAPPVAISGGMNAGVPIIRSAAVANCGPSVTGCRDFTIPKSKDLHEVVLEAHTAEVNVRRFDVPMHQALGMRLREGCAHLLQHVHRAGGWYGTEPLHQ